LIQRISKTIGAQRNDIQTSLQSLKNLDLYCEDALFISEKVLQTGSKKISAPVIIIATGARPRVPEIPGLTGVPYMTSKDALQRTSLPKSMIVIGGGYVAVEIGHAYAAAGTKVSFVVRSTLLRKLDADVRELVSNVFASRHTLYSGSKTEKVYWDGSLFTLVCAATDGSNRTLTADALLVATGIVPQTDGLGLENTGIAINDNGFIQVNDCLETDVPGIYALGDVVGNHMFRHTANYEAQYLLQTALSEKTAFPLDYGPVPYGIFTCPQIAGVGKTEQQLCDENISYVKGKASYAESTPGMARRSEHGFVKILIQKQTRRLLGAHIVGEEATTMIHLFIALMKFQATLDDMLDMIFIHPALPEVAKDAALDARSNLE